MKRILALTLSVVMVLGSLTACNSGSNTTTTTTVTAPAEDVAMQYMTADEALTHIGEEGYVFFDVRKAADYATAHIPGALGYDMDSAKEGDFEAGVATMQTAIQNVDDNIILVCYSGKRYAQAATNVLSALGYDMTKVYTLEGGFTAWSEAHGDTVEVSAEIVAPAEDVAMQYMTAEEAAGYIGVEGYTFFDVRQKDDFVTAHIPGALGYDMDAAKNGDFNAGVAVMQGALRDMDDTLILVCYSGKRYAQATTNVLSAMGYDMSKVYTLEGGFTQWTKTYPSNVEVSADIVKPATDVAMQYMTAEEALTHVGEEGYVFFDVRKAADYALGHIPGAVSHDMDAAKEGDFNAGVGVMKMAIRDLDSNIILVCYSGKRYAQASTNVLSALGYDMSKVYTLEGGFTGWSETYPENVTTE